MSEESERPDGAYRPSNSEGAAIIRKHLERALPAPWRLEHTRSTRIETGLGEHATTFTVTGADDETVAFLAAAPDYIRYLLRIVEDCSPDTK